MHLMHRKVIMPSLAIWAPNPIGKPYSAPLPGPAHGVSLELSSIQSLTEMRGLSLQNIRQPDCTGTKIF